MAKATNPIKHTFLREGELSIDNSDTGGFTYLGIAYNKNKDFTIINEILELVGKELISLKVISSIGNSSLTSPTKMFISLSSTIFFIHSK